MPLMTKKGQIQRGDWRPPIGGPPVQRGDQPPPTGPEPETTPNPPPSPGPDTDQPPVGPPAPPPPPGPEPEAPVGPPKPPPTTLPMKQSFQLPGGRASVGMRLARGLPRQANLQGKPFGSPGGVEGSELLDYIVGRFRR